MESIAGQVASCNYPLPAPPPGQTLDPSRINLVYSPAGQEANAALLPRNDAPGCDVGWQFAPGSGEVVLCTQTCQTVMADTSPQVDLFAGCETQVTVR